MSSRRRIPPVEVTFVGDSPPGAAQARVKRRPAVGEAASSSAGPSSIGVGLGALALGLELREALGRELAGVLLLDPLQPLGALGLLGLVDLDLAWSSCTCRSP